MHTASLRIALIVLLVTVVSGSEAAAQDKGQVGLVIGYPATVGVLWQVSDRLGIRGEGSFSRSSTTIDEASSSSQTSTHTYIDGTTSVVFGGSSIGVTQETHGVSGSLGISALITLTRADDFRTYIAPRVAWAMSRSTTTIEYDLSRFLPPSFLPPPGYRGFENQKLTTKSRTPSYGASFGATTTLRDRFGVFGEFGFAYTPTGSLPFIIGGTSGTAPTRESRTLSLRSGVGVTILF